jgi:hypothetical protein
MTRRQARPRFVRLGAVLAAAAVVLAGCAIPLPTVEADPPLEGPQPALDEVRLDRVLSTVSDVLATADEDSDGDVLSDRFVGPALHTREAEYTLAAATADGDDPTAPQQLTTDPQVLVVGNSDTWPKRIFVFTTIADGMNTPLLIGLEQTDPRADYKMFSWVRLLPEITTPATAVPAVGSPQVAADATGLLLSPNEAMRGYATLLTEGGEAQFFEDDIFRTFVADDREAIQESVEDAGEYSETFEVTGFTPRSLETADGGAIVIGALRSDQVYERTIEDSEMTVGGNIALLAGTDSIDVEESVTAGYYLMVAMYVPPKGAGGKIQVLGAERVLDEVTTE